MLALELVIVGSWMRRLRASWRRISAAQSLTRGAPSSRANDQSNSKWNRQMRERGVGVTRTGERSVRDKSASRRREPVWRCCSHGDERCISR